MQQRQRTTLEREVARQITTQVKRRRGVRTSHRPKPNHKNKESQVLKTTRTGPSQKRVSHRPKPKSQDSCKQRQPENDRSRARRNKRGASGERATSTNERQELPGAAKLPFYRHHDARTEKQDVAASLQAPIQAAWLPLYRHHHTRNNA